MSKGVKLEYNKKSDDAVIQRAIIHAKDEVMTSLEAIVNGELNDKKRYTLNSIRYDVEEAEYYILEHGLDLNYP